MYEGALKEDGTLGATTIPTTSTLIHTYPNGKTIYYLNLCFHIYSRKIKIIYLYVARTLARVYTSFFLHGTCTYNFTPSIFL